MNSSNDYEMVGKESEQTNKLEVAIAGENAAFNDSIHHHFNQELQNDIPVVKSGKLK
jgi:hypothetical protein